MSHLNNSTATLWHAAISAVSLFLCRCLFDRNPPRSSQDSSSSEKSCSDSTFLGQTLTCSFHCQHKRPQIFWLCLRLQLLLSLREPLRDPVTEHHSRCPGPGMSSTSLDMDALEWISACKNHPTPPQTPTYFIHSYVHTRTHTHTRHTALTHSHTLTHICKCTFAGAPPCTQLELSTHAHTATMYSYGTFQKQRYEDLLKAEIKIHPIFFFF